MADAERDLRAVLSEIASFGRALSDAEATPKIVLAGFLDRLPQLRTASETAIRVLLENLSQREQRLTAEVDRARAAIMRLDSATSAAIGTPPSSQILSRRARRARQFAQLLMSDLVKRRQQDWHRSQASSRAGLRVARGDIDQLRQAAVRLTSFLDRMDDSLPRALAILQTSSSWSEIPNASLGQTAGELVELVERVQAAMLQVLHLHVAALEKSQTAPSNQAPSANVDQPNPNFPNFPNFSASRDSDRRVFKHKQPSNSQSPSP